MTRRGSSPKSSSASVLSMNLDFLKNILPSSASKSGRMVTRIAPSPTGLFHVGTARAALFNYLLARKHGGTFIVRIEDTDKARSKKEYEDDILSGMEWLGLSFDALHRQSERTGIYTQYLEKLIANGTAYVSKEASTAHEGEMVEVVRLKNPGEDVMFTDRIRGEITFNTKELGDFVIARSVTEPLYHLAVVVDDHEMGVTHVIRGEDHISNTPRQILIQRALGIPEPEYAHIPLILAPDRSKLSKRKGSTSVSEFRENGYLPEAMVNYLAFLGWNPGTDKELYTMDELIEDFSLEQVQKGGAIFDINKLNWFQREHLKLKPQNKLLDIFDSLFSPDIKELPQYSKERVEGMTTFLVERMGSRDVPRLVLNDPTEIKFFFDKPVIETQVAWKKDNPDTAKEHLSAVIGILEPLHEDEFTAEKVKDTLWGYAEEQGKGSVLWPMRVALSGKEKSPDPFVLAGILGKKETLERLKNMVESL